MDVDLTLLAFRGLIPTVVACILGAGGTASLLALQYRDPWLTVLAAVTIVLCTIRLTKVIQFPSKNPGLLTPRRARQLHHSYGLVTACYCCTVALLVVYFTRFHSEEGLCLSLIGVFCICIGLASRTGTRPWIAQSSGGVLLAAAAYSVIQSRFRLRSIGVAAIAFLRINSSMRSTINSKLSSSNSASGGSFAFSPNRTPSPG